MTGGRGRRRSLTAVRPTIWYGRRRKELPSSPPIPPPIWKISSGWAAYRVSRRLSAGRGPLDIVLSPAFAEDVIVADRLHDLAVSREAANLKGFDSPVPYYRITN